MTREEIIQAIETELGRQAWDIVGPYFEQRDKGSDLVMIDGIVDIGRIADAILASPPRVDEQRKCEYNGGTCTRRGCVGGCQATKLCLAS